MFMKKEKEAIDKSTPYRNLGSTAIKAPANTASGLKSTVTKKSEDMRVKGGK